MRRSTFQNFFSELPQPTCLQPFLVWCALNISRQQLQAVKSKWIPLFSCILCCIFFGLGTDQRPSGLSRQEEPPSCPRGSVDQLSGGSSGQSWRHGLLRHLQGRGVWKNVLIRLFYSTVRILIAVENPPGLAFSFRTAPRCRPAREPMPWSSSRSRRASAWTLSTTWLSRFTPWCLASVTPLRASTECWLPRGSVCSQFHVTSKMCHLKWKEEFLHQLKIHHEINALPFGALGHAALYKIEVVMRSSFPFTGSPNPSLCVC